MKSLHQVFSWLTRTLLGTALAVACANPAVAASGKAKIAVAGSDASSYAHVWITVTEVDFGAKKGAGADRWVKYPLPQSVTVDLAGSGDALGSLCEGLNVPVGTYKSIRIVLAPTDGPLAPSAAAAGIATNNQVDVVSPTGIIPNPLMIPRDLRIEGNFAVSVEAPLNIAVKANASRMVRPGFRGTVKYVLRPELKVIDLNVAGVITGKISFANFSTSRFSVKAEQPNVGSDGSSRRVVKASAKVKKDGSFKLAHLTPGSYDIVIAGAKAETFIVTGVPVAPAESIDVAPTTLAPEIAMIPGADYRLNTKVKPTGAAVYLYQTLPNDTAPYEMRFKQVNPLTGSFSDGLALPAGPLHVGAYNGGNDITFATVTPLEGNGGYKAAAEAPLHLRSAAIAVDPATTVLDFGMLAFQPGAVARQVTGDIVVPARLAGKLDAGVVVAVRKGEIVDAADISSVMATGGAFTFANLAGGTVEAPLQEGTYGLYAIGWNTATPKRTFSFGMRQNVDLSTEDAVGTSLNMMGGWKKPEIPEDEQ